MDKIKLNVIGLSYSQTQSGAYALVLSEENNRMKLPIIIGGFEAQAIAIELEGMKPPRPLTHDLFLEFAKESGIQILEVIISKLEEGIFYSDIIFKVQNAIKKIDARTSDAIALALRFKCPIYTTYDIISKAGIQIDFQTASGSDSNQDEILSKNDTSNDKTLSSLNDNELKKMLDEAISKEDYESAMEIKKEIEKRKKS